MAHSTEIVAWKKLSNGQHSVCIRCCGDEGTDHWHSMSVVTPQGQPVDRALRDVNLAAVRSFVASQHEEMQKHTQDMLDQAGNTTQHQ
jgi:hypothetical protein